MRFRNIRTILKMHPNLISYTFDFDTSCHFTQHDPWEKKLHAREGGFEEYFRCFHYVNLINLIFSAWFSPSPPTPTPLDRCMILKQQWIEIYTIYVFGSKYRKQFLKIKDDSKTPLREKKTQEEGFKKKCLNLKWYSV